MPTNLAPAIRESLCAKLARLLDRPIIARIGRGESVPEEDSCDDEAPTVFQVLRSAGRAVSASAGTEKRRNPWREDPEDGTCSVSISIDYDDLWRGYEREVRDSVAGTVESAVTFLTDEQKSLLERSPQEFLALSPRPEVAELISFEEENVGGSMRVVELKLAAAPESRRHITHLAIVPNLVQLERQLDALQQIESAADDSVLGPLRVLVGLCDASGLPMATAARPEGGEPAAPDERLDAHQLECLSMAMATPHFAVIQGPPGSGKTTVISTAIRRSLMRGERVLVVSPTHVAVDNVVEKLAPQPGGEKKDVLEPWSLPVRYAARSTKLSERALEYWVGRKKRPRGATISRRLEERLSETIPFAKALYAKEHKDAAGKAPLSSAIAGIEAVICGTPIGILSFEPVKNAAPGSFDLLIVDEVSKMTLPEFLAIAVKARRWVLVGDPEQLAPHNSSEESATTLDAVLDPTLELVCTVGAILERTPRAVRRNERLVVVSSEPERVATAIRAHLGAVLPDEHPPVAMLGEAQNRGIVVCSPDESDDACEFLSPARLRDRTHNPDSRGSLRILVERGLTLQRPELASGLRLVEGRERAQAQILENSFNVHHALPWSVRNDQEFSIVGFRKGFKKYLPSVAALTSLDNAVGSQLPPEAHRQALMDAIAVRLLINTVSVYDLLTGIPSEHFDVSPLQELDAFSSTAIRDAVGPFVGKLKKQYRMHASLSRTPRELFYFGEALIDGRSDKNSDCRVNLVQVDANGDKGESNAAETEAICELLEVLNTHDTSPSSRPHIMILTPYREQEALLAKAKEELSNRGALNNLNVEICTLDRCQGREAEYVLISLVRSRSTPFLNMPKRWNVALTRARDGLFIIGNIAAYRSEALRARRDLRARPQGYDGKGEARRPRVTMSVLARIIEAYDRQIEDSMKPRALKSALMEALCHS